MSTQSPPPPPPPPPPGGYDDPFASPNPSMESMQPLDTGRPAVAAAPSRVFIILGVVVLIITYLLFNLFIFEGSPDKETDEAPATITKGEDDPALNQFTAELPAPPPPVFEPTAIPPLNNEVIDPNANQPSNELLQQRIRSTMLISSGNGILPELGGEEEEDFGDDTNLQFAGRVYRSNTEAPKERATHVGDLNSTIAQGKIIHAVLETVINTDLPGNLRAIVSRDIYAEAGPAILVPKGSRLIGQYNASILGGQKRVYVVWTRLIRPDGIDIMVNSPLIDQIGQAGVAGQVDTKFTEIFSRALLTSAITIAIATGIDEVNGDEGQTETTNTDGSVTRNTDLTTEATIDSMDQLGSIASAYLQRFINVQPTILVDQGTPVNVFVNRDLIFPRNLTGARFIE